MTMQLESSAFQQGTEIPKKYTCDGENVSPPLRWTADRPGTQSYMLVCHDPDAPRGPFRHWAAYDIPPTRTGLEEGYGAESLGDGFKQAVNDFGVPGYGGPCPPVGHGPHHYHFRLMALAVETLPVAPSASCAEVEAIAERHVIGEVELVGIYGR